MSRSSRTSWTRRSRSGGGRRRSPPDVTWSLAEPGRRLEEFLVLLYLTWPNVLDPDYRKALPAIFDSVGFPDEEVGEEIRDERGTLMTRVRKRGSNSLQSPFPLPNFM